MVRKMKNKLVKGIGLAMAMTLMATTVAPMTVQAGVDRGSVQYVPQNESYSDIAQETALKDATVNTTMTLSGTLADSTKSLDFTGTGNTLNVQFENLPVGYPNVLDFVYNATLDNKYKIKIDGCLGENVDRVTVSCWLDDTDDEWFYYLYDYSGMWSAQLQNGVVYDIANIYINPILKYISIIDNLKATGATDEEIYDSINAINEEREFDGSFDSFFNPVKHQIISSELYVGIGYDYDISFGTSQGWWISSDDANEQETEETLVETPQEPEVQVETPQESVAPVETPQQPVVTPVVTAVAGDIVYTVKVGDTLGSISANYYGSNAKSGAIREQNKEAFAANKGRLSEGMQLVLPEKLGNKTRIAEPVANTGEALYAVMHGDTLCGIAKKIYGTEKKMVDIFARNSDRLSDSGKLFPGQVIVLPVK